jgi:shikimate kinase
MKTAYILIGPRGSGKTYVGKLIEKELGIKFFSVEPYFLDIAIASDYEAGNDELFAEAWQKIGEAIAKHFENNDKIIFESLGTFNSFKEFLKELQKKYEVKLIKIEAPQELCVSRLKNRDVASHVPMDEGLVEKINKMAVEEKYPFDIIINNAKLADEETVREFKKLL